MTRGRLREPMSLRGGTHGNLHGAIAVAVRGLEGRDAIGQGFDDGVEEALASRAYEDSALPIGFGQTISQPYVVAKVIEILLQKKNPRKVLEVGTGCGYQAAVLAHVFEEVYSVERIKALLERARANLIGLRLANLRLAYADGGEGLPAAAPFDAIVAAAAARQIPEALRAQLAPGGRMILPLHAGAGTQRLVLVERTGRGFRESELDAVHFVPFEAGKA
jgi:protein-L-isoaspartate(D-aspartate) O-methyltransferase